MKFLLVIVGFILGFVTATFWKGGRDLIESNAPSVQKQIEKGLDKSVDLLKDNVIKVKEKIKDNL